MLEYQHKNNNYNNFGELWTKLRGQRYPNINFQHFRYRLDHVVYEDDSEEFQRLLKKEILWIRLST